MPLVHLTAKMRRPFSFFLEHEHADWFWTRMRENFPKTLAGALMPNHPHWLAHVPDPFRAEHVFARTCGHFQRRVGVPGLWLRPPVEVVHPGKKFARSFRYVALNHCRAGLASDPLQPLWSSYRELFGAVVEQVVDTSRLRRELRMFRGRFLEQVHGYVSADSSVDVRGTALPVPAPPRSSPIEPLDRIARAAAVAQREPLERIGRRSPTRDLFWALARRQGWTDLGPLARYAGVELQTVRRALRRPVSPAAVSAAAVCLGDARFWSQTQTGSTPPWAA